MSEIFKGGMNLAIEEASTYSEYISKLLGVINANVVFSGDEIVEVHVLADTTRTPKQIVRDVQSLLMVKFNKEVDHRIVSVAQINYGARPNINSSARYVIEAVTVGKKRDHTEIEVALSMDDRNYIGKHTALKDNVDIIRGIAQATVSAVAAASESIQSFSVLDVRFIDIAGERMAIVCVSLTSLNSVTCRFSGTAFSVNDDDMAIVKATLNAINRRVGHF